jgi:AraC family transcriptional regulator of adaptative response/methylated-DNA-[protein]-cysteine methyltransferase
MPSQGAKSSPGRFSRASEELRYVTGQSSLGHVLLALSEKGAAAILIGHDPRHLLQDLQKQFKDARWVPGNREDQGLLRRVIDEIEAPSGKLDLPLDIRGTPFQLRVWQAVRKISCGQISTYTDIARKIGAPQAMRAVGNACSNNRHAIAIPCHRVLRSDDTPAGRRDWGGERQRALLSREIALPE